MNSIERHDLVAIHGQYSDEAAEEHAYMTSYCELNCIACRKKEIAIAIERLLGLENDMTDKALE